MAEFWQLVSVLREQINGALSRSDVLRPLTWLIGLFFLGEVGLVSAHADQWILLGVAIFFGLTVLLYLGAYLYCLITEPDALRSERYTLQKMAIQRGWRGDSDSGTFEVAETNTTAVESAAKQIEHRS